MLLSRLGRSGTFHYMFLTSFLSLSVICILLILFSFHYSYLITLEVVFSVFFFVALSGFPVPKPKWIYGSILKNLHYHKILLKDIYYLSVNTSFSLLSTAVQGRQILSRRPERNCFLIWGKRKKVGTAHTRNWNLTVLVRHFRKLFRLIFF